MACVSSLGSTILILDCPVGHLQPISRDGPCPYHVPFSSAQTQYACIFAFLAFLKIFRICHGVTWNTVGLTPSQALQPSQDLHPCMLLCMQSSDYEEYVSSFRPDIMEPVTAWVRGARFAELSKMTEIFEVGAICVASFAPCSQGAILGGSDLHCDPADPGTFFPC